MEYNKEELNIGQLLLKSGKLTSKDCTLILNEQKANGMRFGDIAVNKGLVKQKDIDEVISKQFEFSYLVNDENKIDPKVQTAYAPSSLIGEKIRTLRNQLENRWLGNQKSFVLSGVESNIGNSLLCANLAVSFAQLGKNTLLVDSDLRRAKVHSLFGMQNNRGFSDLLASRAEIADVIHKTPISNLSIITAGTEAPNPVELLGKSSALSVIKHIEQDYDVVIYDSVNINEFSDSHILTHKVGGVVLVVKRNSTTTKLFESVKKQFDISNCTIIGSVINDY